MKKFFNWIFKGVSVESRVPKTNAAEAVMDLEERREETRIPDFGGGVEIGGATGAVPGAQAAPNASMASAMLFDRTEGFGAGHAGPFGDNGNSLSNGNTYNGGQFSEPANNFSSALGGATYGNRNILVVNPKSNVEIIEIVNNLRRGDACVVCLEGLELTMAKSMIDFLSGVITALNGQIKRLNVNTYILTPSGVGVKA